MARMRVTYSSCHLTSSPQNSPVSLSMLQSTAFTTFVLICVDELSTVETYLPPPEHQNSQVLSFSGRARLSGSTGALSNSTGAKTQSYRSLSTGRPVSSTAEETSRFDDKFGLKKVGFVKTHFAFPYIQRVV